MRAVAITNQKGGSGKTTTTANLAAALGEKGQRVLVIDLDPQASLSLWIQGKEGDSGLLDMFRGEARLADLVKETPFDGVDLVPSSGWLGGAEKMLAGEVGAETILRRALKTLPSDRWDFVLLDCPPALGVVTVNALTAVPEIVVPVQARVMALPGLASLFRTVETVRDRLNGDLAVTGIVACQVDARTRLSLEVVGRLREKFGDLVFKAVIRENVRLAEAFSFHEAITTYDPRSHGAEDYRNLAEEITNRGRK